MNQIDLHRLNTSMRRSRCCRAAQAGSFRFALCPLPFVTLVRLAARSALSGQPLHLEVLLAFKGLDFRIACQEYRLKLNRRRDGERVGISDRVFGFESAARRTR